MPNYAVIQEASLILMLFSHDFAVLNAGLPVGDGEFDL
jgi:hypothetical protein